jgi:hypothetical protein
VLARRGDDFSLRERRIPDRAISKTTPNATKAQTLANLQALVAGLQEQFPNGSFTLESTAFTTQSLVALLQSVIDDIESLNGAQLNAKAALTKARASVTRTGPTVSALKRNLLAMFGNAPQTLAIFGLQPLKARAPRTVEQKAVAAAKLRATRKARGIASKKSKAAIKGNVTGVVLTPITEPAPTAPAATPPSP